MPVLLCFCLNDEQGNSLYFQDYEEKYNEYEEVLTEVKDVITRCEEHFLENKRPFRYELDDL